MFKIQVFSMVMCKRYNTESRVFTTLSRELAASMVFSACSNSTAPMAASPTQVWPTQAVQHLMSGSKEIRMQAFIADSDPNETGCWSKKWKNRLLTWLRYFCISSTQDHLDALHIYRGEQIPELIKSLESIPSLSSPRVQTSTRNSSPNLTTISFPWLTPTVHLVN